MNNHTLFLPPLESIWFLILPHTARNFLPAASAGITSCVRTYARWRLIRWIFESLQKPAILKETPSGMLHLFYPLRKEPCVILLDLYLPVYDGMAVLRAIRQAPAFGEESGASGNGRRVA